MAQGSKKPASSKKGNFKGNRSAAAKIRTANKRAAKKAKRPKNKKK